MHANSAEFLIRQATPDDLPGILEVERSWDERARATPEKFLARLEKFRGGFFVAITRDEDNRDVIAATVTAMPVFYALDRLEEFETWDRVTNNGYLPDPIDIKSCNGIYIVSGVIRPEYRGLHLFAPAILREVELTRSLGLRYTLAGAVMPGYRQYCEQRGPVDPWTYASSRKGRHLRDPLLAMYEAISFRVPDASHIKPDYFPDEPSLNHAAIVVRDLQKDPL